MTQKGKANGSFFGNFLNAQILSQRPHFLQDLAQVVDFRFVEEHCKCFYADWGRAPWDPVLMFKMVFLRGVAMTTIISTGTPRTTAFGKSRFSPLPSSSPGKSWSFPGGLPGRPLKRRPPPPRPQRSRAAGGIAVICGWL
jgi:hypothetical protein